MARVVRPFGHTSAPPEFWFRLDFPEGELAKRFAHTRRTLWEVELTDCSVFRVSERRAIRHHSCPCSTRILMQDLKTEQLQNPERVVQWYECAISPR